MTILPSPQPARFAAMARGSIKQRWNGWQSQPVWQLCCSSRDRSAMAGLRDAPLSLRWQEAGPSPWRNINVAFGRI